MSNRDSEDHDGGQCASLEQDLLELLMQGTESFGILHTDLIRRKGYGPSLTPDDVINKLMVLVDNGFVRLVNPVSPSAGYWRQAKDLYEEWLRRRNPRDDEYFQEMGPWFEITPRGAKTWERM